MNSLFHSSRRRSSWRKLQIAECTLLIAGFIGVGWFVYSQVDSHVYQSYENYRLDTEAQDRKPTVFGYLSHMLGRGSAPSERKQADSAAQESRQQSAREERRARRAALQTGSLIGRIELPRLNVSTVVREGSDDKTLKRSAGHVPYTAIPGEHGNIGIAAHRDTHFRNLRGVREGDIVLFKTTWGVYEYVVDSLKIVRPENVEVLDPTPEPSITLVTCYPFNYVGSAPHRFIVRARQVDPAPESLKVVPARSPS